MSRWSHHSEPQLITKQPWSAWHVCIVCVCVCVCVFQRKNDKISHRSFVLTWSSSKLHAYCSSLGITCLGKDEATLMLAIQFCPLLLVFLLRCFCSCLCLLSLVQVFPWWPGCSHRESLRNWLTVTWEKLAFFLPAQVLHWVSLYHCHFCLLHNSSNAKKEKPCYLVTHVKLWFLSVLNVTNMC